MGKKLKMPKEDIDNFLIIKGQKGTYYPSKIVVDYGRKKGKITLPTFNRDRKHYTPTFKIPYLWD